MVKRPWATSSWQYFVAKTSPTAVSTMAKLIAEIDSIKDTALVAIETKFMDTIRRDIQCLALSWNRANCTQVSTFIEALLDTP